MVTPESQNTNKESESIVLDLETLTKNYQTLLIEYQQAVVNYIDYIKDEPMDPSANNKSFVTVKGSTYWGTSGISQNNSNTLKKCMSSCENTNGCTGATFNATDYSAPMCFLRKGSSTVSTGKDGDYAIINKAQYLLSIVDSINKKLTTLNQQILAKTAEGQPLYNSNLEESVSQNDALLNKYKSLTRDRAKITQMMNEYQTLEENQIQGNIKVTQNYYSFILLLALTILIVYILYKFTGVPDNNRSLFQSGGALSHNAYYIVLSLLLLTALVYYFMISRK